MMNTHYGQLTDFQNERYHHTSNSSSPFVRQGFGRKSRTSGKFNSLKGLAVFPDGNSMHKDEGLHVAGDDMEGNRIFSYLSHIKETQNNYRICKSVGNASSECKTKETDDEDIPTTRKSKVKNEIVLHLKNTFVSY